jgi:hypothetical protein
MATHSRGSATFKQIRRANDTQPAQVSSVGEIYFGGVFKSLAWASIIDFHHTPIYILLPNTVVFRSNRQSRVTHPPVDIEIWQGSRITRPFVEPPGRHTGLKTACKTQKSQNFRFDVENFTGVTPNFGCCRKVESVDLNEILQYVLYQRVCCAVPQPLVAMLCNSHRFGV